MLNKMITKLIFYLFRTSFMKILVLTLFVIMSGCQAMHDNVFTQSSVCGNRDFEHKSETEIAAMSPEEKMDQMVLEQMFHLPAFDDDNYELLHLYIINDGIKILPKAIEYMNEYDPNAQECKERSSARLLTAAMYIDSVDSAKFRIRAVEDGRVAINALEQAIERRRKSRPDVDDYDDRGKLLPTLLDGLKGQSIKDGLIKETLEKQYNIKMSEAESLEFTNFLISLDPAYPSWTKVLGWAEMTKEESDLYYQAYQKFRKNK
jgi:hypothetical protein